MEFKFMGMRQLLLISAIFISQSLFSKEILLGVEPIPKRNMAVLFTPLVLPDLISAKAAFEYRFHDKFNLVVPLEAKWMDYRWAIKLSSKLFNLRKDLPEYWYRKDAPIRHWNFDFLQFKISTGLGAKWFPFSEAMGSGFFIKSLMMFGIEHFNAYSAEGKKNSAVITHVLTVGYNFVKNNRFTFNLEVGEEYTWHTHPIEWIPVLISGFMPMLQLSLGFTI